MGDVEVHALRGVDFELRAGELIVLLGASGCGKSTLLNILDGLDVPTSGEVTYRGHDLTSADEDELTWYRRLHVGFVFQCVITLADGRVTAERHQPVRARAEELRW